MPAGITDGAADFEPSFVFTLDDLVINTGSNEVTYTSGSYSTSAPFTSTDSYTSYSGSFSDLFDLGVRQFLMPLHGGFDGFLSAQARQLFDQTAR